MAQNEAKVLPAGAQIGVYEIKEVISNGRAGILYRAWNEHLNTMVALKEYLPFEYAVRDDDGYKVKAKRINDASVFEYGKEKFLEFAEILTDIRHPNVVGVHNVLQFNGTAYLAMDFEEGVPLSKLKTSSPAFSESDLNAMLVSLTSALQSVHEKETVHGDVHPSNIIIRNNGEPVLVNFAAARLALASHTKELLQELRPGYAPAELYHPNKLPGPSSDLYSLGATMYYCITRSDPGSILERVEALNNKEPDPYMADLENNDADYSEGLLKAIGWMLNQNAEDRPQSASDVLGLLDQEKGPRKTSDTSFEKTPVNQEDKGFETYDTQNKTGLLIFLLIALGAMIAASFWFFQQEKQQVEVMQAVNEQEVENPAIGSVASNQAEYGTIGQGDRLTTAPGADEQKQTGADIMLAEYSEQMSESSTNTGLSTDSAVSQSALTEVPDGNESIPTEEVALPSDELTVNSGQQTEPDVSQTASPEEAGEDESLPVEKTVMPASESTVVAQQEPIATKSGTSRELVKSPLSALQEEQINQHLAAAEKNLADLNLTTPMDDNAYIHYQAVLAIDPDNVQANEGLERIIEMYSWFIEDAIEEGRYNRAQIYLERAEAAHPDAEILQNLRDQLNNTIQPSD